MKYTQNRQRIFISSINEAKIENAKRLIESSEIYYHERVGKVVELATGEQKNIIMLTGPSSSGKTTTAILIVNQFEQLRKKARRISLDNFYKNNKDIPFWEDGTKNFETFEAFDLDLFKSTMDTLLAKGEAEFPIYDFSTGPGHRLDVTFNVTYDEDTFLIFEGIHALNPVFMDILNSSNVLRLYISPHTDFVDDNDNIILAADDLRLIRRTLRDNSDRSTPPEMTMDLWNKVLRGEKEYIKPFKHSADVHVNSTHYYEPLVYKKPIISLLKNVKHSMYQEKVEQLISAMKLFESVPAHMIPPTSLLIEFVSEAHYSGKPAEPSQG